MKKLLNKKGITLVEVIVVLAIIAILMAIIIPNFSMTDSYQKEARENARAFFSNVQQVMVDEKFRETTLSSNDADTANKKYTLIYAVVHQDKSEIRDKTDIYIGFTDDETELPWGWGFKASFGDFGSNFRMINTSDPTDKFSELGYTLQKLLFSNDGDCYYYALVDSKYRVASTYYSRYADYDALNGNKFSKDEKVTFNSEEFVVGAYPYTIASQWQEIFRNPNARDSSVT